MANRLSAYYIKTKSYIFQYFDPILLLFILLVTNYRISLKITALAVIYIYRPNFKFKKSGIVYFYFGIIVLGIVNLLFISNDLSYAHCMVVISGCLIWTACLLTYHQVKLAIEKSTTIQLLNTLKLLVLINFVISVFDIVKIMLITHTLNPYAQICPPPYGISSGDLIGGIYGGMHLVNMIVSSMMLFLFIYQKNFLFSLFSILPFLLTGSNFGTLVIIITLLYILISQKNKVIKHYVLFILSIAVVFYAKVTPDNLSYLTKSLTKVSQQARNIPIENIDPLPNDNFVKSPEDIKNEKIHNYIAYKHGYYVLKDSVYFLKQTYLRNQKRDYKTMMDYTHYIKDSIKTSKLKDKRFEYGKLKSFDFDKKSGKLISFTQTKNYLLTDWKCLMLGAGIGSFSSRLAFITSGIVDDSRVLMAIPKYENPLFTENHKAIFKYLLFLEDDYHSVTNLPFSWYNELFAEYGVIGAFLFFTFYCGFFLKKIKYLTFGKLLFAIMFAFFFFDYWYQRLSVMVLFELLILLDVKMTLEKENKQLKE